MVQTQADEDLDIGARLKAARIAHRLSQRELARKAGVTNGLISQIEQNHSSPSVSSLKRILDAIPVSMSDFFLRDYAGPPALFFLAGDAPLARPAAGEIVHRWIGTTKGRTVRMTQESMGPGADTGAVLPGAEVEVAGLILSGQVEVQIGGQSAILGPDDGFFVHKGKSYRLRNLFEDEARLVLSTNRPAG